MHTRPTDRELSGMTVNERMFACGFLDRWDALKRERKREEMIELLCQVAFSKEEAAFTTDTFLANPAKYGF